MDRKYFWSNFDFGIRLVVDVDSELLLDVGIDLMVENNKAEVAESI